MTSIEVDIANNCTDADDCTQFLDSRPATPMPFKPKRPEGDNLADSVESLRINDAPPSGPDANGTVSVPEAATNGDNR